MRNRQISKCIIEFADLLNNRSIPDIQIVDDPAIGEKFGTAGFEMDCGHAFSEKYGEEAFTDPDALAKIIESIDDIQILGSALFSKWRYYNHWDMGQSIRDDKPMLWFNLIINRMKELTSVKKASNSENPKNGAVFQSRVRDWFIHRYGQGFELEVKIPIGNPPKDHKFDIVSLDKKIAIECKRYTWTETGNVPSAKMGFTNEAAFYLSFLPEDYEKYIVMLRAYHSKRDESLAEYYYRTNRHLIGNTKIAEYDPESDELRVIG